MPLFFATFDPRRPSPRQALAELRYIPNGPIYESSGGKTTSRTFAFPFLWYLLHTNG